MRNLSPFQGSIELADGDIQFKFDGRKSDQLFHVWIWNDQEQIWIFIGKMIAPKKATNRQLFLMALELAAE